MLVHQLPARGRPEVVAFRFKHQVVTYEQFQVRVNRFRDYLYAQGIRPGENVGLYSKNSPEFVYSYFAIASLGAVVVPLNPTLTPREVAYIVEDARMKNLVTLQPLELPVAVNQLVMAAFVPSLDALTLAPAPAAEEFDGDRECVIIYTSGTTGFPKGAVLSHTNLLSNAAAISEVLRVTEADNLICVLPMFHSFAWTVTVLGSLTMGASVTIMEAFQPKEVINTIREQGVTVVCGVPAMYNYYLALGTPEDFASVRLFVSGGSSLPVEIINQFKMKNGKAIMEGYGLSEASPVVAMNPLGRGKAGSIGKAVPGIETLIVDAEGKVLPSREIGELITRGPNVMKGYFNLPEATANAIVDGWLHTGDLAYADEEGYLYIVDRLKDMIIVGGLNVYPREVEEILYQFPGVSEATVVGVPDRVRGEDVCAFVVMKSGVELDKRALAAFLQTNLATYKLPREVIQLEALPKNATGKIMKKELKARYGKA